MPDPRFYVKKTNINLEQLIDLIACQVPEHIDLTQHINDVATLEGAGAQDISFFHNTKYIEALKLTQAKMVLCRSQDIEHMPAHCVPLIVDNPYRAYAKLAETLYSNVEQDMFMDSQPEGSALCHPAAKIGQNVIIEPGVIIMADVIIGDNCKIGAYCVIRNGVTIGNHTLIGAQCVISHSLIGSHVKIYPGVKLGQAGFGFVMDEKGHISVPQLGRVVIQDQVEIGANTTIDRGTLEDTVIGTGTRIDNLVQIGHGVKIGEHCVIVALVGISGSTEIGNHVIAAGQVGIAGHLKIGNNVVIAAKSGVVRDIADRETVGGIPAVPIKQWHRQSVMMARLAKNPKG